MTQPTPEIVHNIGAVLATEDGMNVLWEILNWCGIYSSSLSADPLVTAQQEGKRAIGIQLIDLIQQTDPRAYAHLLIEMQTRALIARQNEENRNVEEAF